MKATDAALEHAMATAFAELEFASDTDAEDIEFVLSVVSSAVTELHHRQTARRLRLEAQARVDAYRARLAEN